MRFVRDPNGWYRAHVSDNAIASAKRRKVAQDERPGFDDPSLWRGYLAEAAFARFLAERRIPYRWNGGVDSLPDFVVRDLTIGVHAIGWKGEVDPLRWEVDLSEGKSRRDQETWQLFAAFLEEPRSLIFFGVIATDRFFAEARFVPKGSPINPYSTLACKRDQHRLPVRRLSDVADVMRAGGCPLTELEVAA